MEKLLKPSTIFNRSTAILGLLFFQSMIWAQDKDVDVSLKVDGGTTTTTTEWYAEPWMWVVGGAIFLLIVIALVRGNKK